MSGLAAVFHRDGRPVAEETVRAMLAAAPYRGPDGMSWRCWGSVSIGHAKMALTAEEQAEQQPLVSPRTGCALIADARLDNRAELLSRLPGRPGSELSDAELLLRAYETWEERAPAHLVGDFAFVVWDPRRRHLVCARDTSGQRGLFYRVDQGTFAAASEIQQLLQDPAVPIAPNAGRIRDSLTPHHVFVNEKENPATFFAGIWLLPAGHTLVIDASTTRLRQYWQMVPPAELRYRTDAEYAEHYRTLFFDVIKARLRSVHPVGVMLSGGLDSSSVACTAQELYRTGQAEDRGFTSFSIVYDGLDTDERHFIAEIQAKYGFNAVQIPHSSMAGRLQLEPAGFQESPTLASAQARDRVFGAAEAAGVRTLLTGDVADACILGSWLVFDSLLRQGKVGAFLKHLQAYRRVSIEPLHKTLVFQCLLPMLPLGLQNGARTVHVRRQLERHGERLLPAWMPDALRKDVVQRHARLAVESTRRQPFSNPARAREYAQLYPPFVARHPAPWPLHIVRPFADRRLHEFLLAIPPEQKFQPQPAHEPAYAGAKWLVRRAMRGILPEDIRTRRVKTTFSAAWDSEFEREWATVEAAFGPAAPTPFTAQHGYIDRHRFWSRLLALREGKQGPELFYILQIVGLETWLRMFELPRAALASVPLPCHYQQSPDRRPVSVGAGP